MNLKPLIVVLFFFMTPGFAQAAGEPEYSVLQSLLERSAGNTAEMCAAIRHVSAELKKYPNDAELLRMRVNAYRSIGSYFSAKKDADKLAGMFPGFAPYQLLKCMLLESTGGTERACLACYNNVLRSYGNEYLKPKDPYGYVLLLFLAKSPDAEKTAREYLTSLPRAESDSIRAKLRYFDRRAIVPRIEPGTPWRDPCPE